MDDVRLQKAEQMRTSGMQPYASSFERTHTLKEALDLQEGKDASVCGRVMLKRAMGKIFFLTLQDHTGKMQMVLRQEEVGEESFENALNLIDLGDFIGVHGKRFATQKGEPSVKAASWEMLSKALHQPPEKWHGVADQETAWRQRYLDLTTNRETFDRFTFRSNFLKALREFYWAENFIEVETPVLVNAASGALATPFKTHHEAYDLDVFLRIAPETFLKECLVGGFDRVFEVARVFRNEGIDPSHLQDFTMVEHYSAYWDYKKNMEFTEKMFTHLLTTLLGTMKVQIPDRDGNLQEIDFTPPWPRVSIRNVILDSCGIDIALCSDADALRDAMKEEGITLEVDVSVLGRGNLIDQLYKKVSRPKLVQPTFLTEHPLDLSPLARKNDANPEIVDRFQLVVGGWEIVNAYSEIVDAADQEKRFTEQAKAHAKGDSDAHEKDDEFVKALSYGCPPCSGWGMGVDRIVALLTQQANLRDVVLFPLMKPQHDAPSSAVTSQASKTDALPAPQDMLLEHADYGHLLEAAHGLLAEHATNTKAHLIATGVTMEALAKKLGGDAKTWKVAGMLHDLDWDSLDKDADKHCGEELQKMLEGIDAPQELLADIRSHYAHMYGEEYPLNTMLRKALYCTDELTGFIIAVTLVRPSKKIADVEVKSVKKKLKDKAFAAQVDRKQIGKCEELLGVSLDEMIELTLDAMKEVADELGL